MTRETAPKPKPKSRRRWLRRLIVVLLFLLLAPAGVTLLYRFVPPPLTPLMVIRSLEGMGLEKEWRAIDAIAPALPGLVIAAEDNLFCRHTGFDRDALAKQIEAIQAGQTPRGASTITMQLAKNLFLWPQRSFLRKGLEAWLTVYLELLLPKRRILELYLNVVEWGPGIYGVEAAAQTHFGVDAGELSETQASLLAAVLPNPLQWSAGQPGDAVRQRAALYRQRLVQLGAGYVDCFKELTFDGI
jgi:monofunctional biosynthetic peptidoglycan transglycosylase